MQRGRKAGSEIRNTIAKILEENKENPLTGYDLYKKLQGQNIKCSLRTVYYNLYKLKEQQKIESNTKIENKKNNIGSITKIYYKWKSS